MSTLFEDLKEGLQIVIMKKITQKLMLTLTISTIIAAMVAGCGKKMVPTSEIQSEAESFSMVEKESENVPENAPEDESNEAWKWAYYNYIRTDLAKAVEQEDFGIRDMYYRLIYIDGDDIPELVAGMGTEVMVSYHDGRLIGYTNPGIGGIYSKFSGVSSYIEKEGKFVWTNGANYGREEIICTLDENGFAAECIGSIFYDMEDVEFTNPSCSFWEGHVDFGDDIPAYYCAEGEMVQYDDPNEFWSKMGEFYDYSKGVDLGSNSVSFYNYGDLMNYLLPEPNIE